MFIIDVIFNLMFWPLKRWFAEHLARFVASHPYTDKLIKSRKAANTRLRNLQAKFDLMHTPVTLSDDDSSPKTSVTADAPVPADVSVETDPEGNIIPTNFIILTNTTNNRTTNNFKEDFSQVRSS